MSLEWPNSCTRKNCQWTHWTKSIIGEGAGKTVYCGLKCRTKHKKLAIKFYKDKYIFEEDYWSREIEAHKKAKELAIAWNETKYSKSKIKVLVPKQEKVHYIRESDRKVGEYYLVEPYLSEFEKFNSNTMTSNEHDHKSIQAFSHWTYHHTNGKLLFCDCQGMFDKNKQEYILTDPVIVSNTEYLSASYGPCDGGEDMMMTWFNNHKCNRFCKREWMKPLYDTTTEIQQKEETSYIWQSEQSKQQKNQKSKTNQVKNEK